MFHKNWIFVPGYYMQQDGPTGKWIGDRVLTFQSWHEQKDFGYDIAILTVEKKNGMKLSEAVGALSYSTCNYRFEDDIYAISYSEKYSKGESLVATIESVSAQNPRFDPYLNGIANGIINRYNQTAGGAWIKNFKLGEKSENYNMICGIATHIPAQVCSVSEANDRLEHMCMHLGFMKRYMNYGEWEFRFNVFSSFVH